MKPVTLRIDDHLVVYGDGSREAVSVYTVKPTRRRGLVAPGEPVFAGYFVGGRLYALHSPGELSAQLTRKVEDRLSAHTGRPRLDWEATRGGAWRAVVRRGDHVLLFWKDADPYPDTSYLGTFHANHRQDALDVFELLDEPEDTRRYRWYVPTNYAPADYAANLDAIIADVRSLLSFGDTWEMLDLCAGVFKADDVLDADGDPSSHLRPWEAPALAHDSICGVQSNSDEGYIDDCAWECAETALRDAAAVAARR